MYTFISGLIARGVEDICKAPFESRCGLYVYELGPSNVVVVADDAHDSLLPQCEVNGLNL